MAELHPNLKVGTSSWSNAEWPFYPTGMKPGEFIAHYSRRFPIVEVDSSFYHAPAPSLCARWYQAVPESFRFALKVPQDITHKKTLLSAEKEWESFLEAVKCLREKLGYLVLQFPYFNRSSSCPMLGEFLKRLGPFLSASAPLCPLVVEVRNKTWVGKDLFAMLAEHKTIFALTEQEWMPKPKDLFEKYGPSLKLRARHSGIDCSTSRTSSIVMRSA